MLTDLPLELFRAILLEAVRVRGITRGLRLRLVSRFFSVEVLPAVFESGLVYPKLKSIFQKKMYWRTYKQKEEYLEEFDRNPHFVSFCQSFATSRAGFLSFLPRMKRIVKLAEILCAETGNSEATHWRKYIHSMCYSSYCLETEFPVAFFSHKQRYLLQAAIINGQPDIVSNILSSPDVPQSILSSSPDVPHSILGHDHRWGEVIEHSPMTLAGKHGNRSILRLLLSPLTAHLQERNKLREEAFYGAVLSGCIPTIQFILSPEFGRVSDFSRVRSWVRPVFTGVENSASVDFCHQIYELVRSLLGPNMQSQFDDEPDLNDQLHRNCTAGIQREDVTKYLLDKGATVQDTSYGATSCTNMSWSMGTVITSENRWNPLRAAVNSGHEKIVRVLLDAGADPNKPDHDVLWLAAQRGRLDIVRLLLDHGAKVNMVPSGMFCDAAGWEMPLLVAERTENDALCELLKSKMTVEEKEAYRVGSRDSEKHRLWKACVGSIYGIKEWAALERLSTDYSYFFEDHD